MRDLGAMVALELVRTGAPTRRTPSSPRRWCRRPAARGLVILSCGVYSNVIRFLAPLTISDALLKEGCNLFEQALEEVAGSGARAKAV